MKSFILFTLILFTVSLSNSWSTSAGNTADAAKKERATVTFSQPVHLMDVELKGQYLFVHDDLAMARGAACTYVYEGDSEIPSKLIVSFHCTPIARSKTSKFTVRTLMTWPGRAELTEYQFGGSSEGHMVPMIPHIGHVNIASEL